MSMEVALLIVPALITLFMVDFIGSKRIDRLVKRIEVLEAIIYRHVP